MCGLNVLHALILETSGYTVISKQRWRTIADSRQSALWRIGVRLPYTTSAVRQRHQHSSTRTRIGNDNGNDDASNTIKLQREKSTLSSGNERASFGVAEARAYCALLLRFVEVMSKSAVNCLRHTLNQLTLYCLLASMTLPPLPSKPLFLAQHATPISHYEPLTSRLRACRM